MEEQDDPKQTGERTHSNPPRPLKQSKGKLILALGLLSLLALVLFSIWLIISKPFGQVETSFSRYIALAVLISSPVTVVCAIVSAVMGYRELNRITRGITHPANRKSTAAGMWFGAFSSILLPIGVLIILSRYSESSISKVRDSIIAEMTNLSTHSYEYRIQTASQGGGEGSYFGYRIPAELSISDWGIYTALVLHADTIEFTAKWSLDTTSTIAVTIGPDGQPVHWIYQGHFQ